MNNQFDKLIERVGTDTSGRWISTTSAENFAELIVKDCIQTLVDYGYTDAATCLHEARFGPESEWQTYKFPEI